MTLAAVLLILIVLGSVVQSMTKKTDELYMYSLMDEAEAFPVKEYLVPKHPMKSVNDTAHLPDFLSSTKSGPRVVEFYAPWCPHCRKFKQHYIDIARSLTKVGERMGQKIEFWAVSCVAHDPICKHSGVPAYPAIHAFPAGSINGTRFEGWEVHPFRLLTALGIEVEGDEGFLLDEQDAKEQESKKEVRSEGYKPRHVRNKVELYEDAFLSFDFAIRTGIFMDSDTLTNSTKDALKDWLVLLQQALPPTWKIQSMIRAIVNDFDEAVKSEDALLKRVTPHRPEHDQWSSACSHEDGLPGYTCGLWELFHIMTVGVVEWNGLSDSEMTVISTTHAADTLRDYIANFFACEVCQRNFLTAYDSCSHDRCNRLVPYTDDPNPNDWKQLSLWLWETHNSVNVRLLHERAEREGRTVTPKEEVEVQWPSRHECPACWREDGTWEEELIYKYLRISYWPDDALTKKYRQDLDEALVHQFDDEVIPWTAALFPLGALAFVAIMWYTKRVRIEKSGRHKKWDDGREDYQSNV